MAIKLKSFRSKIIITVIAVVSLFSSFAFYIYSNYLSERIFKNSEENSIAVLDLINEPSRISKNPHNSNNFNNLIDEMTQNEHVLGAYYLSSDGKLKHSRTELDSKNDSLFRSELPLIKEDVTYKTFKSDKNTYSRAFVRLHNASACNSCHSTAIENLGYIVFDFSINQTEKNINFTRKFSISFTVFLVIILGGFVLLMHYRFVRSSLSKFRNSIEVINHGDLNERVSISKSKELGGLARCFNIMLDKFQETTRQLKEYHDNEMQDAQKLATIGEMSARLAHEIRNPITGIANAIEIIVEETEDEENKTILEEVKRQAFRVNEAISKLLKYSGDEKLTIEKGNINDAIKSIVFFLKNQSGSSKITFVMELHADLPEFNFDKEKIENVIMNLSLNAMQAIDDKGVVTFKTVFDETNNNVIISIEDTGIGIPEDKIHEIFKPFYTTKTEGTGLGMAIIKDTVELHNGKVKVSSKLGDGTKISFFLPIS